MKDHSDRIGYQVGDYRLLRWLGGGGFGDVYLGEHIHEQTQAAVKILQARLTRHEDLKEFINEARTMRLKHPHIIPLIDFGIASDDTPFLVMAYAPYGTLRDRHPKDSRLPLSTIVSYVRDLSSALQYAHSLHLVHRDVKPENMLVGPNYEILLSDFGIAAVAHSSRSLFTEQAIGGTLPYMAPEQIAGKPRAASDQYALGITAFEWIAGRRPFTGTAVEIAMQHTTTSPPSLRELVPTLPSEVEQVVFTALAKDPKSRFADIEAFASAFEQASQQTQMPRPLPERSSPAVSPRPVPGSDSYPHPTDQVNVVDSGVTEQPFSPIPSVSESEVERMPSVTQPVDEPITSSSISPTASAFSSQEVIPPRLPHLASTGMPRDVRRLSWKTAALLLVLGLLILGSAGVLYATRHVSPSRIQATATAVDAYDKFVATNGIMLGFDAQHTHANPYERILNPTTVGGLTKKWTYLTGDIIASSPAVAGGVVYFGGHSGKVYALDAASGAKKWTYLTGTAADSSPAVAGGVVYIGSGDGNLYALDAVSGAKKWAFKTGGPIFSSPTVAGGVVYIVSFDGSLYALDATSGAKKWAYSIGSLTTSSPAVAGSLVYIGSRNGNLYALDATSGAKKWTFQVGLPGFTSSPAVASGMIYIGSDNGYLYALDAASGMKKWAFQTGGYIYSSPAVAGGVVYIGSHDREVYALDAVSGTEKWAFQIGSNKTYSMINSSPALAEGVVYIGSHDGDLYTFHLPNT